MAYINATTTINRVKLVLVKYDATTHATLDHSKFYSAADATTGALTTVSGAIQLAGLQDITINNANGLHRWKQLDKSGESVITTVATNSLSGNFVLDPTLFFGSTGATTTAETAGIFGLSNNRIQVAFMIAPSGAVASQTPDNYLLMGNGYISSLAPKVSADSPVWLSPITVEVNGDYTLEVIA
jgi:hypothetical protein